MPSSIPAQLGRYEVIKRIGKGSMGLVYLARDPVIQRLVALKTFRMELTGSDRELEQYKSRFIREAQSAGILTHPNIVTIHDVVEDKESGRVFIAMEYVRGANLKELLDGGERFDLDRVGGIVSQIASALDYAHEKGVVHRDVKPANVILDAEGGVKVTDFGIARLDSSDLTQEGQLLGTPNYMSPEQILTQPLDHRTDIFSLGVLIYEMITVHKPFQGHNFTSVSHKIVYEDYEPPEQYVADLPDEVRKVLHRALAKEPDDRFQSAGELADELLLSSRFTSDPVSRHSGVFEVPEGFVAAAANDTPPPSETAALVTAHLQEDPAEGAGSDGATTQVADTLSAQSDAPPASEPVVVVTKERRDRREVAIEVLLELRHRLGEWLGPVLTRRLGGALAGIAVLSLLALFAIRGLDDGEAPGTEMDPEHQARLAWVMLVKDARQAMENGDPATASELLRGLEGNDAARRPEVLVLRSEVERQLQELERIQRDARRIDRGLEAAQEALAAGDFEEAARLAEGVLEVAPGQGEALAIVEQAREALEEPNSTRPAVARPRSATGRASAGTKVRREVARPSSAVASRATILLVFRSEVPEGVLSITQGPKQVFREGFSFERTGVLRRKAEGQIERSLVVSSGQGALRIHVTLDGDPTGSAIVEGDFPAGGEVGLEVLLTRSGELQAELGGS